MKYRFMVNTAGGLSNFLTIIETPNGDVCIHDRGAHTSAELQVDGALQLLDDYEKRVSTQITVHPNLQSKNSTVTVNYKTVQQGAELSRSVVSALEVRQGARFFPVLASVGINVAAPKQMVRPGQYQRDRQIHLWPGQCFDWSIQSLGFSIFICNPDMVLTVPQGTPEVVQVIKFKHLQVVFVYWAVDKPTRGASVSQLPLPSGEALVGLDLQDIGNFIGNIATAHSQFYDKLPDFLPSQLAPLSLPQLGVRVVDPRTYLQRPSFSVQANRDASLLRLSFQTHDGARVVVDLNGKAITEFHEQVGTAIRLVPGLASWGQQSQ